MLYIINPTHRHIFFKADVTQFAYSSSTLLIVYCFVEFKKKKKKRKIIMDSESLSEWPPHYPDYPDYQTRDEGGFPV